MARRGSIAFLAAALSPRRRRSRERLIESRANVDRRSAVKRQPDVFDSADFSSRRRTSKQPVTRSVSEETGSVAFEEDGRNKKFADTFG